MGANGAWMSGPLMAQQRFMTGSCRALAWCLIQAPLSLINCSFVKSTAFGTGLDGGSGYGGVIFSAVTVNELVLSGGTVMSNNAASFGGGVALASGLVKITVTGREATLSVPGAGSYAHSCKMRLYSRLHHTQRYLFMSVHDVAPQRKAN